MRVRKTKFRRSWKRKKAFYNCYFKVEKCKTARFQISANIELRTIGSPPAYQNHVYYILAAP